MQPHSTTEHTPGNYQLMPPLSDEEYQSLKADIALSGVLVPIELDEHGDILDGHHRVRAWTELRAEGVKLRQYNTLIRANLTEQEKRNHVRALNVLRRHLSKDALNQQMVDMRQDGMTLEAIAKAAGVSEQTVMRETSQIPNGISEIVTARGQKRPAKYKPREPKTIFTSTRADEKKALAALPSLASDSLPDKTITTNRAARLAREADAQQARDCPVHVILLASCRLILGDFRDVGQEIPDASVDLIFTDPPYPREFTPLWSGLSAFAARVLKPAGMLVAYTGAMYLPEIIGRLCEHLDYWWTGAIILDGPHSRVHTHNIAQGSKPLLFYTPRGSGKHDRWFEDTFRSEGEQKAAHEWQQSQGCAEYYIAKLTDPGDLVVDPFLGGGTTGAAALKRGRCFVGIEIDPAVLASAQARIANGQ